MFCFAEIADSPEAVKRFTELFWWDEKGTTPASMLLPWLPSKARKLKEKAAVEIFMMLSKIYEGRIAQSHAVDDTTQLLMDNGHDLSDIIGVSTKIVIIVASESVIKFILGNLYAGICMRSNACILF